MQNIHPHTSSLLFIHDNAPNHKSSTFELSTPILNTCNYITFPVLEYKNLSRRRSAASISALNTGEKIEPLTKAQRNKTENVAGSESGIFISLFWFGCSRGKTAIHHLYFRAPKLFQTKNKTMSLG